MKPDMDECAIAWFWAGVSCLGGHLFVFFLCENDLSSFGGFAGAVDVLSRSVYPLLSAFLIMSWFVHGRWTADPGDNGEAVAAGRRSRWGCIACMAVLVIIGISNAAALAAERHLWGVIFPVLQILLFRNLYRVLYKRLDQTER